MNPNIFREYDIRGIYPTTINEDVAYKIGRSYGSYIQEKYNQKSCIVSHDNRLSSESLNKQLISGILESGCNVIDYGLCTTPMHYYARYLNKLFGIQITASHNPKDDNGFKFSFDDITNARGDMIRDFEKYTLKEDFLIGDGKLSHKDITEEYLKYLKSNINIGNVKRKIIIDCGNGTTSIITRKAHDLFDLAYEIIFEESDGNFPNHHPDPNVESNLEALKKKVIEEKADVGIAYDGDGDRIGLINERGEYVTTEEYMIIIIRDLINKVNKKEFLYDLKCTKSLEDEIKKLGGKPIEYRSGASYTEYGVKTMNLPFGGEYSGHIYFNDRGPEIGSAIYAGLRIIEILTNTTKSLSELYDGTNTYYSTPMYNIKTTDEIKFDVIEKIKGYLIKHNYNFNDMDGVKILFDNSWALIRASNTGPNLTVRCEANTPKNLNELKKFIDALIEKANK